MPRDGLIRVHGRMLWSDLEHAHRYAHARHLLYKRRQLVQPERHEGQLLWHVRCARLDRQQLEVSEPCS